MTASESGITEKLNSVIDKYRYSFTNKVHADQERDTDALMRVFGITDSVKVEHHQYWGRELGMCFQRLVANICSDRCLDYKPAITIGRSEPCDLVVGNDAIDTKYRLGSGDSGIFQKFRRNAGELLACGLRPVMVIMRSDSSRTAVRACEVGGWLTHEGAAAFAYLKAISGFDLSAWLDEQAIA